MLTRGAYGPPRFSITATSPRLSESITGLWFSSRDFHRSDRIISGVILSPNVHSSPATGAMYHHTVRLSLTLLTLLALLLTASSAAALPVPVGAADGAAPSYDALYRLKSATGRFQSHRGHDESYQVDLDYDAIHNVTAKTQEHERHTPGGAAVPQHRTSYEFDYEYGSSRPHAPTHVGGRRFQYDLNGNQLGWDDDRSGRRRTILWDAEDRPRSISDNGRTTEFVYAADGTRVFKRGRQGETAYVNAFFTVRNREIGTKHIFIGASRIASKLSPGETYVAPESETDPWMGVLGRWHLHRSASGLDHARNVDMNPHYRVPMDSARWRSRLVGGRRAEPSGRRKWRW